MTSSKDKLECIVRGMETYFRTFALADNVRLHARDVEWITPNPGSAGPSLVYQVSLDESTVDERLAEMLPELQAGVIPSLWVISSTSTPADVADHLHAIGFTGGLDAAHPEPGMALDLDEFAPGLGLGPSSDIEISVVASSTEFAAWIDVVNEALHGWNLLSIEHYRAWLEHAPYTFYLGCHGGTPVATLATLRDREAASVEFVSTLKAYRRKGVATALCVKAVQDLRLKRVRLVTLRSGTEAISVYARLGFKPYYEQHLLSYPLG